MLKLSIYRLWKIYTPLLWLIEKGVGNFSNTLYTFDAETKIFTINNPRTGEKYQGSYDWNIDSLTLKYNDMTEKYGFKIATGRHHYLLWADKTEEYRLRYPDAGITSVRVKKIWYDYDAVKPDFGLVI